MELDWQGIEVAPRDGIVRIVIQDGQGGGFVRAHTKSRDVMGAVLDVTTAPIEGYSPTLDISADEIAAMRSGGEEVNPIFYFKLNGLYGKGFVNFVEYRARAGTLSCDVFFLLQPDGSTNVETTSW